MDESYKEDIFIETRNPKLYSTDEHWHIGVWWTERNGYYTP